MNAAAVGRGAAAVVIAASMSAGCRSHTTRGPTAPVGEAAIPRVRGPIVIDGKCDEPSWQLAFRSPSFIDAQGRRNPSTQLRATADADNLYIEVFVADVDVESHGDVVKLDAGPVHIEVTPKNVIAPAGVRSALDVDDTIDNPKDDDEEWVGELAIPWSLVGGHDVPVRALRIDVGRNGPPHALAWPRSAPTLLRFDPKTTR
jgi:hypothetical protein